MRNENAITTRRCALLVLGEPQPTSALERVLIGFCGRVVRSLTQARGCARLYVCGDLSLWPEGLERALVIRELCTNLEAMPEGAELLGQGQVPLLVHDVGVMYPRLFDEPDLFARVQREHTFQNLTESTKGGQALRTGIYLTDVAREVEASGREVLHHRLLRCSSNLTGPTDNFRPTDRMIMAALNDAASAVFDRETSLNHVLAQIYRNSRDDDQRGRERKARIGAHSDKTKDMRADGLIAFCTLYDPEGFEHLEQTETGDWCYQGTSGLTRLYFRRKSGVEGLASEFTVTLYPNSVFLIPLSTNRLYTHEIRPSALNVERIPTRMGYVARSSKAEALFMDGHTYLKEGGALRRLEPMTYETLTELRGTYREENLSDERVAYGDVRFSMNQGDYQRPIY